MKEIENISDVYTDIGNGEIVPDIINNLYKAFLSAKTIDKKYKAYMDFNDDNMYNLMSNSSIVQDTNMKDFAKECGYSANKIDNYLNQIHADPNNNVYEHFERSLRKERMRADLQNQDNLSDEVLEKAMKDPEKYDKQAYDAIEISVEDIVGATAKEFSARTIDNFITKGMKYQVKKHNITLDRYNEIQNAKLLSESANYMKGKKSVRGTTEGQNRFNNALDSLGILSEFAPKTASQINVIIDRINKVRNAEGDSKNRVKLSDYNEKRSAEASKIDSKKQNVRSK